MITPEQLEKWLSLASEVVTLAAILAAITPTPVDDGVVAVLRRIIDVLAFNWGHAANQKRVEDKQDVVTPRPE